jgi:DNA-binding CsgD family transcriptional regulator
VDSEPSRATEQPTLPWRATEQLTLLNHAERVGELGSWEWLPSTGALRWSDNCFRIFGLEPGSITPSMELLLRWIHPTDRDRFDDALPDLGTAGNETLEYRILRDDGMVRNLIASVAIIDGEGGDQRVVGSVKDVTSERRTDRALAARVAVSKALSEWESFESGTRALLSGLAIAMDVQFAVLWLRPGVTLNARLIWHENCESLTLLAGATGECPVRESSMLGRAWKGRAPVCSNQPAVGVTPHRAAAIADAGLQAGFAVPAVCDNETLAVVELLAARALAGTDRLMAALNGIGHEVGYFLGNRRGELVDSLLTPRELEVLQLAARSCSAVVIAQKMRVSPATVKRHFEDSYARLGVGDRAAAVAVAMRRGLID